MREFYYKGQNITQVAEVVSNDIVTPTSAFFENWIKYFHADKISISGNSFSFTGIDGWAIVGCKLGCVPNTTNTIRFNVVSATINGGGLKAGVRTTPPDIDGDVSFIGDYYITGPGEVTISFNPGNYNSVYLVFNGGYLGDGYTHTFTFDFSRIRLGMVRLTGITDSNYHLVSTDTGNIAPANEDAFEGRLQINGIPQQYCRRGYAPKGDLVWSLSGSNTRYLHVSGDTITINTSSSSASGGDTISGGNSSNTRKILTIVVIGGGGGGGAGDGGGAFDGGNNGTGGGSGGIAIATIDTTKLQAHNKIVIGGGGGGGSSNNANGGSGESSYFCYGTSDSNKILLANGGGAGSQSNHGSGGGGSASVTNQNSCVLASGSKSGASGGSAGGNPGGSGGSVSYTSHNISVLSNVTLSFSGSGGAGSSSGSNNPSGGAGGYRGNGGAAGQSKGASGSAAGAGTGAGGGGGDSDGWETWGSGGAGGSGWCGIYY